MIDIKFLRENPDIVKDNIKKKFQNHKLDLVDEVIELDKKYRASKLNGDNLRSERKNLSNQIGSFMKNGEQEKANEIKVEKVEIQGENLDINTQIKEPVSGIEFSLVDERSSKIN